MSTSKKSHRKKNIEIPVAEEIFDELPEQDENIMNDTKNINNVNNKINLFSKFKSNKKNKPVCKRISKEWGLSFVLVLILLSGVIIILHALYGAFNDSCTVLTDKYKNHQTDDEDVDNYQNVDFEASELFKMVIDHIYYQDVTTIDITKYEINLKKIKSIDLVGNKNSDKKFSVGYFQSDILEFYKKVHLCLYEVYKRRSNWKNIFYNQRLYIIYQNYFYDIIREHIYIFDDIGSVSEEGLQNILGKNITIDKIKKAMSNFNESFLLAFITNDQRIIYKNEKNPNEYIFYKYSNVESLNQNKNIEKIILTDKTVIKEITRLQTELRNLIKKYGLDVFDDNNQHKSIHSVYNKHDKWKLQRIINNLQSLQLINSQQNTSSWWPFTNPSNVVKSFKPMELVMFEETINELKNIMFVQFIVNINTQIGTTSFQNNLNSCVNGELLKKFLTFLGKNFISLITGGSVLKDFILTVLKIYYKDIYMPLLNFIFSFIKRIIILLVHGLQSFIEVSTGYTEIQRSSAMIASTTITQAAGIVGTVAAGLVSFAPMSNSISNHITNRANQVGQYLGSYKQIEADIKYADANLRADRFQTVSSVLSTKRRGLKEFMIMFIKQSFKFGILPFSSILFLTDKICHFQHKLRKHLKNLHKEEEEIEEEEEFEENHENKHNSTKKFVESEANEVVDDFIETLFNKMQNKTYGRNKKANEAFNSIKNVADNYTSNFKNMSSVSSISSTASSFVSKKKSNNNDSSNKNINNKNANKNDDNNIINNNDTNDANNTDSWINSLSTMTNKQICNKLIEHKVHHIIPDLRHKDLLQCRFTKAELIDFANNSINQSGGRRTTKRSKKRRRHKNRKNGSIKYKNW